LWLIWFYILLSIRIGRPYAEIDSTADGLRDDFFPARAVELLGRQGRASKRPGRQRRISSTVSYGWAQYATVSPVQTIELG
jgi:hypothetical protein